MSPSKRTITAAEAKQWALQHWGLRPPQPGTWHTMPATPNPSSARSASGPIEVGADEPTEIIRSLHRPGAPPVVIRGAAKEWTATKTWSLDWLAANHGDHLVPTDDRTPDGEIVSVPLREAVTRTRNGESGYARFSPLLTERPELVDHLDLGYLLAATGAIRRGVLFQLFSGGQGTSTETHCAIGNNAFAQVRGEKIWRLVAPHQSAALAPLPLGRPYFASIATLHDPTLPTHADADIHLVHLRAGDVVLVPPFWWHQVHNPTESIGVAMRWHHPAQALRQSAFLTLMTLSARNPNVIKANRDRRRFGVVYQQTVDQSRSLLEPAKR